MASTPFGIAQVDVPGLLGMHQQMKQQRLSDLYRESQLARQAAQDERQAKLDQRADKQFAREEAEFDRAEKARKAISEGAKPQDVIAIDPNIGFDYAKHSSSLDEAQRKAAAQRAEDVGSAALYLAELPEDQLRAQWDSVIDRVVSLGYTDLAQYKGNPNRAALGPIIAASKDAVKAFLQGQRDDRRDRISEGNLAVSQGNLALSREREGRINKWGPQPLFGVMPNTDTSDLNY